MEESRVISIELKRNENKEAKKINRDEQRN
jgi:hypothetical protein